MLQLDAPAVRRVTSQCPALSLPRLPESHSRALRRACEARGVARLRALLVCSSILLFALSCRYTYHICPFHNASQDHTNLGTWNEWRTTTQAQRDEGYAGAAGAFGLHDRYWHFSKGRHCFSGADRSLSVFLTCAAEEAVLYIDEPEACTYRAVLGAPAFCVPDDEKARGGVEAVEAQSTARSH